MGPRKYHSKTSDVKVYHNTKKCTEGNNIERKNLTSGTGSKRLCKNCKKHK